MAKETIDVLIEGGKATAAPPLGPALGPIGVNIGEVVAEINKKTADFKGMKVPVKVIIDTDTKQFEIEVGTPPAAQLIKTEAKIKKAASNPLTDKVADLKIEQVIKISKMKESSLLGKDNFQRVKEICGTCQSMGVMVEGKPANETIADINKGSFKEKIESGKTELSADELKDIAEEKKKLEEELEKRRTEFEATGKKIMKEMEGKDSKAIRAKMTEEGLPAQIVEQLLPTEKEDAKGGAAKEGEAKEGAPAAEKKE